MACATLETTENSRNINLFALHVETGIGRGPYPPTRLCIWVRTFFLADLVKWAYLYRLPPLYKNMNLLSNQFIKVPLWIDTLI